MKRNLFYFAWRELIRSANLRKNMDTKGVLIFIAIYFSFMALIVGFNLSEYIENNFPSQSPISAFNSLIFIYIGSEFVIRIMVQNLPTFGFKAFLIVPVKRKRIARYMLNKSVFHFFNILPLFLILPFALKVAINILDTYAFIAWLASLLLMIFINHFLAIYVKWRTNESTMLFYGFLLFAFGIFTIDYYNVFDITASFGKIFDFIILNPLLIVVFIISLIGSYFINYKYLINRFYLDELSQKKKEGVKHDFSWLNQVGEYGKMLSLEVKMIVRNKRPRTTAMMSVLFIFYGLILYKPDNGEVPETILVIGGMFMIGIFGMMYGQFFPAWHSRYYPFLMSQNIKMKQILQSAFFLITVTNIVFYLFSLAYILITPKVLYIHFVVMLYNVGVNTFVIFALGLGSRKAIDLERGAMFNYQGSGAAQWLMVFPIILGPLALYGILSAIFGSVVAYSTLGVLGLIGIILHPRLIDYFTKKYLSKKHIMISAYKNS